MITESTPADDVLLQALERSDTKRRPERAERIRWSSQHEIGGAVVGPVEAMNLLREARECFAEGHYIATLMLATALIEHVISEELVRAGKTKYGLPFERAIALAKQGQLFPDELLESADKLRVLRNPFAHRKPDNHEHTLGNRYMAQKRHPRLVAEEDARVALVSMYGHFRHALRGA